MSKRFALQIPAKSDAPAESPREERKVDPLLEELSISCARPKRATSLKRQGPRVIGTKVEKKKEPKQEERKNRFAKKKNPDAKKEESHSESGVESSAFSFTEESPGPIQEDEGKSAFDFVDEDVGEGESAFQFVVEDHNEEKSAFDFMDDNVDAGETPFFLEAAPEEPESDVVKVEVTNDKNVAKTLADVQQALAGATSQVKATKDGKNYEAHKAAHQKLLELLDTAMRVTYQMKEMIVEEGEAAKSALPQAKDELDKLKQQLADKRAEGVKEEMELEEARKSTAASVDGLRREVQTKKSALTAKYSDIEERIERASDPFTSRLAEIEQEKEEHEKAIQEMRAEIERRERLLAELDKEYDQKMKDLDATTESFQEEQSKLDEESKKLELEEQESERKIRQLEAPYQSILDSVEARKKVVQGLENKIDKTTKAIDDFRKDSTQAASAALIVEKLSSAHKKMCEKRVELKQKFEGEKTKYERLMTELNPRANESKDAKNKASKLSENISVMKQKLQQLEADKKSAIAAKNFMAAKSVTQQMKELQDQLAASESSLADVQLVISGLEAQGSQASSQLQAARDEIEDLKYEMLANDYNFYESTIAILDGVFELSPYGSKLLAPLQKIMLGALAFVEKPPSLDPEKIKEKIQILNDRLNEVVEAEKYEEAAVIQEQIDRLSSKLKSK